MPHISLCSNPQFICRLRVEDTSGHTETAMGWIAGHHPRSRRAGTGQGRAVRGEGWSGRGTAVGRQDEGRARGRAAPGRFNILAQPRSSQSGWQAMGRRTPALRLLLALAMLVRKPSPLQSGQLSGSRCPEPCECTAAGALRCPGPRAGLARL